MDEVQGNQGNYEAISALPSFRLFPWFFVIPGVLLLAIAVLLVRRPTWWRRWRAVLIVLGVALIVAPAAFQMFARAPKGGQMMSAFKHIETTQNVERIQGYFGTMAEGQGAIRLEIVPALEQAGLAPAQIHSEFPAVASLDAQWVHILNDMTPMIGAMSDNVANYQAISSLPPFPLFPWFFVLPGVIVAGVALAGGTSSSARQRVTATSTARSVPTYQGVS
jgi:4-amino-4-deoxy-L-arabinose transferase-like glycosyltransferase